MGTPNVLYHMYAEGGARVGDHASSVLGRVADSKWHRLTIVAATGKEEKVCTYTKKCYLSNSLQLTNFNVKTGCACRMISHLIG